MFEDTLPQLRVSITDAEGKPIDFVTVKLFNSKEKWVSQTDWVKKENSDINNFVYFNYLEELDYYILAEKDTLNNIETGSHLKQPLEVNKLVQVTIILK